MDNRPFLCYPNTQKLTVLLEYFVVGVPSIRVDVSSIRVIEWFMYKNQWASFGSTVVRDLRRDGVLQISVLHLPMIRKRL